MKIKARARFGLLSALFAAVVAAAAPPQATADDLFTRDVVRAQSTDVFHVDFFSGRPARIVVDGDRDTDLDLYVYDENGNLIASDTDRTDYCIAGWTPRWTGTFRIEVQNLGRVYNRYSLSISR